MKISASLKVAILALVLSLAVSSHHDATRLKRRRKGKDLIDNYVKTLSKSAQKAVKRNKGLRLMKSNNEKKKKNEKKDLEEEDQDENVQTKGEVSSDRHHCDIEIKKDDVSIKVDKKVIDMKYFQGKLVMVGQVNGESKECGLLDLGKCMSSSRNHLARSSYFKAMNMNENKIRFSFHFFVGMNREMGLCSVRVAVKHGQDEFLPRQKVMSYFPEDIFDVSEYSNQKSFNHHQSVFNGKTTQEALEICARPFEQDQKIFISNFYSTFEGFLLAESQKSEINLKCEKNVKQSEVLFRGSNESGLKKVDVFMNNNEYSLIAVKMDQNKISIQEKNIDKQKRGTNFPQGIKAYSVQMLAFSSYNFYNNQCYDLDRKNVMKGWVKTTYDPSQRDNNSGFQFDVAVMAQEGPSGTMCALYGLMAVPQNDDQYVVQHDLLLKYKKTGESMSNDNCASLFENLHQNVGTLEVYSGIENRYLAGSLLSSAANIEHKVYCHIDVSENLAKDQFRQEQYNRIFYETAVTQFVDNNNEDQVNSAINAQIEAAQRRIGNVQQQSNVLPTFHTMPYDLTTRQGAHNILEAGQTLINMDFLRSTNGLFAAVMMGDNNLCIFLIQTATADTKRIWCSGSTKSEQGKGVLKLQTSGELQVVNSASGDKLYGPNQQGTGSGFYLAMLGNGNLVVMNSAGEKQWSSNTNQVNSYNSLESVLISNKVLFPAKLHMGLLLRSQNKKYLAQIQSNGNLVIKKYKDDKAVAIWSNSAEVDGQYKMSMHLSLQDEGNLIMYQDEEEKVMVWETNTGKKGGVALILTDDGSLQVVDQNNAVIWTESMMPNDLWKGPAQNELHEGDVLYPNTFVRSQNGRFVYILKEDLELQVLMKTKDGKSVQTWSSGTKSDGKSQGILYVNSKGIVVVKDITNDKVLFKSTGNNSDKNYFLRMQNDGNLIVYGQSNIGQWSIGFSNDYEYMVQADIPSELSSPFTRLQSVSLMSPNKKCMFLLQYTGQVSTYDNTGKIYWATSTTIGPQDYFREYVQLTDMGELSMWSNPQTQQWVADNSKQKEKGQYKLVLGDDCIPQIQDKAGTVTWDPTKLTTKLFNNYKNELTTNQKLRPNQCLNDKMNMYSACMSPMGSLLIYVKMDNDGTGRQVYDSKTTCGSVGGCELRVNGNTLEIYDFINKKQIKQLATGMSYLIMQCDGNLVAYNDNIQAKFASNTSPSQDIPLDSNALPSKVQKPHTFYIGGAIMASPNKQYNLVFQQWDGSVVIKKNAQAKVVSSQSIQWHGKPETYLIFQQDTNLVEYITQPQTKPVWASGQWQSEYLELTNDGKLQLLDKKGNTVWHVQM